MSPMRVPVELRRAYRLLNHGPATLVSAAAGGRVNVMAAAWVMPLVEVVAAWADDDLWDGAEWHFSGDERRTIHHLSGSTFFATGARIEARRL